VSRFAGYGFFEFSWQEDGGVSRIFLGRSCKLGFDLSGHGRKVGIHPGWRQGNPRRTALADSPGGRPRRLRRFRRRRSAHRLRASCPGSPGGRRRYPYRLQRRHPPIRVDRSCLEPGPAPRTGGKKLPRASNMAICTRNWKALSGPSTATRRPP